MNDVTRFAGRTVLITGASSGVGRHLATSLAAKGARIVACARRQELLDDLESDIAAEGGTCLGVACDVADAASITAAFDAAEARFGAVDSVICNAGINKSMSATKLPVDAIDAILSVNVRGAFLTAREGAMRMIKRGATPEHRRILFIASIMARKAMPGAALYSATKAGVVMMSKALALEWARHSICVNAVLPGFMPTDIIDPWFESDAGRAVVAGWPRGRFMPVADLDPAIDMLLSEAAASITGAEIVVDDAQSIG